MKVKKIFLIIDHLRFGGAQLQILNAYKELIKRGYLVKIINLSNTKTSIDFEVYKKDIINFNFRFKFSNPLKIFFLLFNYLRFRPYKIVSYGYISCIYTGLVFAFLSPKIIFMDRALYITSYSFIFKIYSLFLPFANKVISNSLEQVKYYRSKYGLLNKKFLYQSNIFFELPNCSSIIYPLSNSIHLVSIGRVDKDKNYKLLIESFLTLKTTKNIIIDIIGSFSDEKYLKELESILSKLEKRNGNIKINFLGHKSNPFESVYKNSIFIMTSKSEGFPNVIVEAMYNNLTIIAPNLLQIKTILENYGKSFIFENTKLSLKEKIEQAIFYNLNTNFEKNIGDKNFEILEIYKPEKFLHKIFPPM